MIYLAYFYSAAVLQLQLGHTLRKQESGRRVSFALGSLVMDFDRVFRKGNLFKDFEGLSYQTQRCSLERGLFLLWKPTHKFMCIQGIQLPCFENQSTTRLTQECSFICIGIVMYSRQRAGSFLVRECCIVLFQKL